METKNYFLKQELEREAWKKVSEDFRWTEELLEKYQDKVDWPSVSRNGYIDWTPSMLEKFKHQIDWSGISALGSKMTVSVENLERFKAYWDWKELSGNSNIQWSVELLERFADKWDWVGMYGNFDLMVNDEKCKFLFNWETYKKFRNYILDSQLKDTLFWDQFVEEKRKNLLLEIVSVQ